ncbi:hypothetical protein [Methanobacterium alcaliphilum]|uniref:hypothetical protein n=1 Tax=Methanobacterium alcaliphilum TaxID=392018 RepID=UPI00200B564E|nr:hypothetical protein [Methanobacterium alcaliphilum]MCK9151685.1 hypothetical protein [Methanobacterium alcaliphilum]
MVHYQLDEIPDEVKCSKCGKQAEEVEGSYQQTTRFVLISYKCPDCGNIEKLQCGRPVDIID